ncbi:MAG: sulfatase-like hydrolase/transferase [Myxococcales bacterium]
MDTDRRAQRHGAWIAVALVCAGGKLWQQGVSGQVVLGAAADGLFIALFGLVMACGADPIARRRPAVARGFDLLLGLGLAACLGLVFAHTWFFDAAIERRLTVFDVTSAGVAEFFREVLPAAGRLALLVWLGFAALLGWGLGRVLRTPPLPAQAFAAWLALALSVAIWGARAPRVPSVLFDSAAELWAIVSLPKLEPTRDQAARKLARELTPGPSDQLPSRAQAGTGPLPFRKLVVLVMETMTSSRMADESRALPAATFVHSGLSHAHRYAQHVPNNQDSRTGMLNMLFSRLIPYEAYTDQGLAGYAGLSRKPSLVDRLQALGYRSAFAVSQVALEEVVRDLHWDQFLHWSEAEIEQQRARFVCLAPDIYENGCEDRALLPKVLAFLSEHERAFVYQEFIWGHAPEYNERTGLTNTAYYSAYVDALLAGLRARELERDTLIVLTSDHGFRDKSLQTQRWVYEIPLWFFSADAVPSERRTLTSHADFERLLMRELGLGASAARDAPALVVGPTGNGMLTALGEGAALVSMRRRGPLTLLVRDSAPNSEDLGGLDAAQLLGGFELYRQDFDAWLAAP